MSSSIESQLQRLLSNLWEVESIERSKATELLSKILNNIISNRSVAKFSDLNFQKVCSKFDKCPSALYLLHVAGFKQSVDGTRLKWTNNNENYIILKKLKDALQQKLKEPMIPKPIPKTLTDEKQSDDVVTFIKEALMKSIHDTKQKMITKQQLLPDLESMTKLRNMKSTIDLTQRAIDSRRLMKSYTKTKHSEEKEQFDEEVVSNLVSLGVATRDECIRASQMVVDFKNPNAVFDKLEEVLSHNYNIVTMSDVKCTGNLSNCPELARLIFVLTRYHMFIQQKQKQNMDSLCNDNYNMTDIIDDFHHLLNFHDHQFEEIHNLLINDCYNGNTCTSSKCLMLRRNHRNRASYRENNNQLRKLYLNSNEINDIIIQQIFDAIHCHYFHSFDVGYKLSHAEIHKIQQADSTSENDSKEEINNTIYDKVASLMYLRKQNNNVEFINTNSNKFRSELENAQLKYSFGVQFFYWKWYKYQTDEVIDPISLQQQTESMLEIPDPANDGYNLSQFYVESKYDKLKDELLNNPICSISTIQWDNHITKAKQYIATNQIKHKKCCQDDDDTFYQFYNIPSGSSITVQHVTAIIIHCAEDELQRKFGETFRRIPRNESNYSILKRHGYYANLARLLRELVDCFGQEDGEAFVSGGQISPTHIEVKGMKRISLYHGTSILTQFASTNACIKGPCSTTTSGAVAINFAGPRGMILELALNTNKSDIGLFDCQYLSNYPAEKEIFFVGGTRTFSFLTIIIPYLGQNYTFYISALTMIVNYLCRAMQYMNENTQQRTMDLDPFENPIIKQTTYRMMLHECNRCYPQNELYVELKSMPAYIKSLMHYQFQNLTKLNFHWIAMRGNFYGTLFRNLFHYDNGWLKLDLLITLFPSVYSIGWWMDHDQMKLLQDASTYQSILAFLRCSYNLTLSMINLHAQFGNSYEISQAMTPFKQEFEKLNWMLYFDGLHCCVTMKKCGKKIIDLNDQNNCIKTIKFNKT